MACANELRCEIYPGPIGTSAGKLENGFQPRTHIRQSGGEAVHFQELTNEFEEAVVVVAEMYRKWFNVFESLESATNAV
ncbi:hypothetical protein NX059_004407 [Plenodomus lindquistii]|nr:hypothetical protein NX059_004407 [Plenodomus lindquistii]